MLDVYYGAEKARLLPRELLKNAPRLRFKKMQRLLETAYRRLDEREEQCCKAYVNIRTRPLRRVVSPPCRSTAGSIGQLAVPARSSLKDLLVG